MIILSPKNYGCLLRKRVISNYLINCKKAKRISGLRTAREKAVHLLDETLGCAMVWPEET